MKEKYIPSTKEVKKVEKMMTDKEKEMSEEREATFEAGKNSQLNENNGAAKEAAIKKVKKDGGSLEYVPEDLKADKDVVLEAVKENFFAIKYAHKSILDDKEFVLDL